MASDALPPYSARPPVYTENDQIATVTVDILGARSSADTMFLYPMNVFYIEVSMLQKHVNHQ